MLENAGNLLAKKESEKFSGSCFEREVKRSENALRFMRYCQEVKMETKTLRDRVRVCYPDNKEYLDGMFAKFKSKIEEFESNSNYTFLDHNDKFVLFLEEQYDLKMSNAKDDDERWMYHDELSELKTVNGWLENGYIDFNMENKNFKGYKLGEETPLELDKLKESCDGKSLRDGLILPDGTFYQAIGGHVRLMEWLMMNGVDCKSAIRTFSFLSSVSFGDLTGYCKVDNSFKLTPEQARAMFNLYRLNKYHCSDDFQKDMFDSRYLGFTQLSNPNLRMNLVILENESQKIVKATKDLPETDHFVLNEYYHAAVERARRERFLRY